MTTKLTTQDIKQISTSACETLYDVNGVQLRLWIITGGTPALAFNDFSFTQRYSPLEKWKNKHYNNRKYDHQLHSKIQGPTFEVLPHGIKDVQLFIERVLSKRDLRQKRFNSLPMQTEITSKRFHDKDNRCYSYCTLNLRQNCIAPVTVHSNCYAGRCDDLTHLFPNKWSALKKVMNPLCDSKANWEDLSEKQFQKVCKVINDVL